MLETATDFLEYNLYPFLRRILGDGVQESTDHAVKDIPRGLASPAVPEDPSSVVTSEDPLSPVSSDDLSSFEIVDEVPSPGTPKDQSSPELVKDHTSSNNEEQPVILTDDHFVQLMSRAAVQQYQVPGDQIDKEVNEICLSLFKKDYDVLIMNNLRAIFCRHYPLKIVIPVKKKNDESEPRMDDAYFKLYQTFAQEGSIGRCRRRFPVPAILWNNKFICRSATVTNLKSASSAAFERPAPLKDESEGDVFTKIIAEILTKGYSLANLGISGVGEVKNKDASILGLLDINCIADLMVENRKVHTAMYVCSSEKVNQDIYKSFSCLQIPYPGCEFFEEYSKIRNMPNYDELKENLIFEWVEIDGESALGLTKQWLEEKLPNKWGIDYKNYKKWNLIEMTKIYLHLLLHYLNKGKRGMLVHCISGWDRTPLFISLLRVILWADKEIHQSLNEEEMAYLILGFDWYLFGHNLPERMKKKEEIMHFFINVLKEITSSDFSVEPSRSKPDREIKILKLREILLDHYDRMQLGMNRNGCR